MQVSQLFFEGRLVCKKFDKVTNIWKAATITVECRLPCDVDPLACESTSMLYHRDKTLRDTVSRRNFAFAEGLMFSLFSIIMVSPNRSSWDELVWSTRYIDKTRLKPRLLHFFLLLSLETRDHMHHLAAHIWWISWLGK